MSTKRPDFPSGAGDTPVRASRFAYHAEEEAGEGGVHSVGAAGTRATSGAPGPAERLLDISELARMVGMRYTHRFHIPPYPADDIDFTAPLDGEVTLTNTGALLLLRGNVRAALRLECARCLELFVQEVEAELEEEFDLITTRNAFHQEEVQAVDEDTPASVIQGNVLNLGELLRQDLLLAAPLQPLCREDCPGLDLSGRTKTENESPEETPQGAANPLHRLAELLAEKQSDDTTKE